jgi:hypothetical protein
MITQHALDVVKVVGVLTGALGVTAGFVRWLSSIFKRVAETNRNVILVTTNHLPHIQAALDRHTKSLAAVVSDIRDVDTKMSGYSKRLDDTKSAVDSLSGAFLNHLNSSRESIVVTVERKPEPKSETEKV